MQFTGLVHLQGYSSNLDEYTALMTAGVNSVQQFGLGVKFAGLYDDQGNTKRGMSNAEQTTHEV
ncbi:hypothetical protein [Paraburkholderia heleia]|nr:hypothetical protein [Paraburkholderia heleia]